MSLGIASRGAAASSAETDPPTDWEVPPHSVTVFSPKRTRFCVCVFVLNEGERIQRQLERMGPYLAAADVIIADGGSTDGALAPERLEAAGVRVLLTKTGPGRLSAQMRMAYAYALNEGYAGIVSVDGNNKDDPKAIPTFLEALENRFDHVQGSRYRPGGRAINTPLIRAVALRLVHAPLVSLAARHRYTDTTNGFRAYSRRLLIDPRVAPFRDVFTGYELHYYLAIRAARLGYAVTEVPVTREYPAFGPTPTKISPIRGNYRMLRALLKACLHQYDPPA